MSQDNKKPKRQMDDNIDDLGRRPDGTKQNQPGGGDVKPIKEDTVEAERDDEDSDGRNPSPMNPAFP